MDRDTLTMLIVTLAIWLALSMVTETLNPLDALQRALNAGMEITDMQLTDADQDGAGNCIASPEQLAEDASATLGSPISVEEYALARMCACESLSARRGGSDEDKYARIWVALNDASRNNAGNILQCLTGGHYFGPQGSQRKYSTGHPDGGVDPTDRHLALVRACLSGATPDPTGGATHFMDKYGFADANHKWDPNAYAATVASWTNRGWRKVLTIGRGLEIWT